MRKFFSITVLSLFIGFSLGHAQNKLREIEGAWQRCDVVQIDDGVTATYHAPVWKIFYPNGQYMIFFIPRGSQKAILSHAGVYEYVSEGCFTETSTQASQADAPLIGVSSVITYKIDGNIMKSHYKAEGLAEGTETWERVVTDRPDETAKVPKK